MNFPNKPKEATHFLMQNGYTEPGGSWVYRISFFKQVGGEWMIYVTDTDNEYPGWSVAEKHYRNKKFEDVKENLQEI